MAPILRIWLVSWIATAPLLSKDLGDHGHLFPIIEEDLLETIRKKLDAYTTNDLAALERKICQRYFNLTEEPPPVIGLEETKTYRSYFYDPSTVVSVDIADHLGNVIVAKGTTLNPLTIFGLADSLLFIDGSKESHLKWAESQETRSKWILVKGRPLDIEERNQRPIYFDQFGYLTKKLGITHVPAKVSQEGLKIKIEELCVKDLSPSSRLLTKGEALQEVRS